MKIVFSILLFIISGILIFTYVKISQPERVVIKEKEEVRSSSKKFSFFNFKKYELPARELFMRVDLRNLKTIYLYKVIIKLNDKYSLFNVREILDSYGVIYSLFEKREVEIFILFKNFKEAKEIFNLFKEYKLPVKIEKIEKRI